jgi:outer membrane receptor protein involved in Fe transport
MSVKGFGLERSRLSAALFAALVMPVAGAAFAQDAATAPDQTSQDQTSTTNKATTLDKVVVTGSLIPQTQLETFTPVTIISAEDLQTRGFTSVADALQRTSFATGTVQGNQTSASFTQGAETTSLFGLNPGYTKYLIDGRPMANYPALYNGSDVFNNISGIPIELVERIEILPGGQSSLYGSDAIAGVINIILKKKLDGTAISARFGKYTDGGGESQRYSIADSMSSDDGRFNVLLGAQFEKSDPIWAYDRDLTKQINLSPYNGAPRVASRDWLITGRSSTTYVFLDPNNCANVADGFGGTEAVQTRPGRAAPYCGSMSTPGYRTLKNGKEAEQVYGHATFDLNDNVQLYGDVLYSNESSRYHIGSGFTWWGTSVDWGHYYDTNRRQLMNLQRAFAPEDMGGWERSMNRDDSTSYAVTFGANGTFGDSNWDYDVSATRNQYKLVENQFARLDGPINQWFIDNVLGPQQGLDPIFNYYPAFAPDYSKFYTLMTPDDFNSFTGFTHSHSKTYDNMLRAQITNSSLFSLPGGDAGLAVAIETGTQGWNYTPDALLVPDPVTLKSQIWGTTSVTGDGSRSRYAVTTELRLPLWEPLTVSLSGRYDSFKADGEKVSKPTYSLGLEYRPFESLLFRGKYGTAFKAPTLSDQFQGLSGFYSFANDYLTCNQQGFDPSQIAACPVSGQFFGQQAGNLALDPITAKVWSYGVVWAPTAKFSIGADYHHWSIKNEVAQQSVDGLMLDEYRCTPVAQGGAGELDPNSGTCQSAFSQVHRLPDGTLDSIFVTKINVAREIVNAVTANANYLQSLGSFGDLKFNASYTRNLRHDQQTFPTDPVLNLLDPFYSQDPKVKANASVAWSKSSWTTTLYADYMGPTPNNRYWLLGKDAVAAAMLPRYVTYNASVNWSATPDVQLSLLVNTLTNKYPDNDHTYDGLSGAPYDANEYSAYGRSVYLEARWNFGKSE